MRPINLKLIRVLIYFVFTVALGLSAWGSYFYIWLRSTVVYDGTQRVIRWKPVIIREALKNNGITLGPDDITIPAAYEPLPKRKIIRVIRVRKTTATITETLPFRLRWKERFTQNLRPVELERGTLRTKYRTMNTIYHDGVAVSSVTVRERTIAKTIYRLSLIAADGTVEKSYDLSQAKKMRMLATAYYPGDPLAWRDGTVTFLGQKMQRGIVAVDPRVIPLHTRVYVSDYGYGYAGDTGSAIKRKRIDLGVNNAEEEKRYMHVPVTVYILEKSDKW